MSWHKVTPAVVEGMLKLREEGLGAQDISDRLGLAESTVRSYIGRGDPPRPDRQGPKGPLTPIEILRLRQLHAEGKNDPQIARVLQRGQSTVAENRRELGLGLVTERGRLRLEVQSDASFAATASMTQRTKNFVTSFGPCCRCGSRNTTEVRDRRPFCDSCFGVWIACYCAATPTGPASNADVDALFEWFVECGQRARA